jgi:hypothetical protein
VEDDNRNRKLLDRTVYIAGYGRFKIRAQYEKVEYNEEEFAHGSVEFQPDLPTLPVPAMPSTFIAAYIGYKYEKTKELILSDVPEKNLWGLDNVVDLYDIVDTLENLCRDAGFILPDNS